MDESVEIKKEAKKKVFKPDVKNIIILLSDYIFIILAYVTSLMTLCEMSNTLTNAEYLINIVMITPFYALGVIVLMYIFRLYVNNSTVDMLVERRRLLIVNFIACIIYIVIMKIFKTNYPNSFYLLGGLLQLAFTSCIRFVYRLLFDKKVVTAEETED